MITIRDYGRPEYLDGAQAQFFICKGKYPYGEFLAYCDTIEVARAIAHALATGDETVIIEVFTKT